MTPSPPIYKTSTYFVHPVISLDATGAPVLLYEYYNETNTKVAAPTPANMGASLQGGTGDFVAFKLWRAVGADGQHAPGADLGGDTYTATLYAAVAKTVGDGTHVPNFVLNAENYGVMIPIYKGTTRGVILIFQVFRNGVFVKLAASPDPEIGNSTNGAVS
jgi:hypothetical protein